MLIGEYNQTIDAKGRVNVPSKFRDDLGGSFVVSKGLDNCVCIYPKDEWERFKAELDTVPASRRRMLSRFFFSGAEECDMQSKKVKCFRRKVPSYPYKTNVIALKISVKLSVSIRMV